MEQVVGVVCLGACEKKIEEDADAAGERPELLPNNTRQGCFGKDTRNRGGYSRTIGVELLSADQF